MRIHFFALGAALTVACSGNDSGPMGPQQPLPNTGNLAALVVQAELVSNTSPTSGLTLSRLHSANWDCQQRGPLFISCAPPGIGLPPIPSLGEDGRPVYQLAVFALDGTPIGTAHFLRAELYHGQTCAFTGQTFVLRGIIGYYECFNTY